MKKNERKAVTEALLTNLEHFDLKEDEILPVAERIQQLQRSYNNKTERINRDEIVIRDNISLRTLIKRVLGEKITMQEAPALYLNGSPLVPLEADRAASSDPLEKLKEKGYELQIKGEKPARYLRVDSIKDDDFDVDIGKHRYSSTNRSLEILIESVLDDDEKNDR